ncbi:hypothetical protein [Psychroserpens sp. Hel_I_66]|uniref:hypothetical protein n=1 Tax=Psychroserpens sp. Hel_I_66 TaxID=1250004 RepID=UPI0012E05268|nr:hypothetical protein [Psychroserpens sp. Hel_I_66]
MSSNFNSKKPFQFAIISIVCLLLFILFQVLAASNKISEEIYTYVSGFSISVIFVSSIIGFIFSMKGLNEPFSVKKIIGLLVNSIFILLLIALITANTIDFKTF